MKKERWGALPLGELHPGDRCAFCGYGSSWGLKRVILASTNAEAPVCKDTVACMRRKLKRR